MVKKKNCLLISQHFYPEEFVINDLVRKTNNYKFKVVTAYPSYPNFFYFKKFYNNLLKKKNLQILKFIELLHFQGFLIIILILQ